MKRKKYTKRRKQNPKENITDILYQHLCNAILYNMWEELSKAISYYHHGYKCDDCGEEYGYCTCEGDRELKDRDGYNEKCQFCKQRYCLCDYLAIGNARLATYKFAKSILNTSELYYLKLHLLDLFKRMDIHDYSKSNSLLQIIKKLNTTIV